MRALSVHRSGPLHGEIRIPGDKSISHRALLLAAIADGTSSINGFLASNDSLATLACVRNLGITVEELDGSLFVHGHGRHGLLPAKSLLNCVRSGTAMRLLAGILSGQPFESVLTGQEQLRARPMGRIVEPLTAMGARIETDNGHAPLVIRGGDLHGITYEMPIASAQVKSALLLAGLYADSPTSVREPGPTRDHSERMLAAMGAKITVNEDSITILPSEISPVSIDIPGDFSSAAFPLVARIGRKVFAPHVLLDRETRPFSLTRRACRRCPCPVHGHVSFHPMPTPPHDHRCGSGSRTVVS